MIPERKTQLWSPHTDVSSLMGVLTHFSSEEVLNPEAASEWVVQDGKRLLMHIYRDANVLYPTKIVVRTQMLQDMEYQKVVPFDVVRVFVGGIRPVTGAYILRVRKEPDLLQKRRRTLREKFDPNYPPGKDMV